MKIVFKLLYITLIASVFCLFNSCDDYLDRKPLSGPSDENYFNNEDELMLVVNGLYASMTYHPTDDVPQNLTLDCASDISWDRNTSPLQSIGRGDFDSNNAYILSVWTNSYKTIGKCNFVLDNMGKLDGQVDAAKLKRYAAEARFIRAFTYQMLVDFFGAVPLMNKGLSLSEAQVPRSPKKDVVDFILSELTTAAADLPASYSGIDVGRATKGAALAIRARAALNDKRWEEAIVSAKEVMDSKTYSLHSNFEELFQYAGEKSNEIIFAFQYLRLQNTKTHSAARNFNSRNAQGTSNKIPSQALVDAYLCTDGLEIDKSPLYNPQKPFENRDPRLGFTVALPGSTFFGFQFETHKDSIKCWDYSYSGSIPKRIDNQDALNAYATFSGYLWKKYVDFKDKDFTMQSELNITQARYAEVLLNYAEAKIEANQIDATVYDAINQVRQRPSVEMPAIPSGKSQGELRAIVRKERLYELANEGFRMVDLRRWGLAEKFINGSFMGRIPKGIISNAPKIDNDGLVDYSLVSNKSQMRVIEIRKFNKDRDYLWPIPNIEMETNQKLEQNPGY